MPFLFLNRLGMGYPPALYATFSLIYFRNPPYCFPILLLLKSQLELSSRASFSVAPKSGREGVYTQRARVIIIVKTASTTKSAISRLLQIKRDQRDEELV